MKRPSTVRNNWGRRRKVILTKDKHNFILHEIRKALSYLVFTGVNHVNNVGIGMVFTTKKKKTGFGLYEG